MKIVWALLILVSAICTWSCKKDPPPTPPPVLDTLGNWKKVFTSLNGISDVWFITPEKGFLLGNGLQRSLDEGMSWVQLVNRSFSNLFFLNPLVGYAQGQSHFAYSLNGGDTWQVKNITVTQPRDIYFVSISTGYLSALNGLYKTSDTGNTWNRVYDKQTFAVFFLNSMTGYIYADNKLLKTDNAGNTWQTINDLVTSVSSSSAWYVLQFIDDKNGMLSTSEAFYYTTDGGNTWKQKKFANPVWDIHFFTKDVGYLLTTNEIFKTTDGGANWTRSCKIASGQFIEIYFTDVNTGWAAVGNGTLLQLK